MVLQMVMGRTAQLKQYNVNTIGKTYKATFEVLNYVSGMVGFWQGSGISVIFRSADGIYTEYFTATSAEIRFRPNNFIGSITNVSVKEVLQDWTATNANIYLSNNQLVVDDTANLGFDSRAYQTISTTSGKTYRLTFDRISTTSVFWLAVGSGNPNPYIDIFRENLGTDTG